MKKLFTLAAVLAMTSTAAFAQFSYGVKAGLNLAKISNLKASVAVPEGGKASIDSKFRPAFYVGGFAEYQCNEWFAVAGELLYSEQGGKIKGSSTAGTETINLKATDKFGYLNVPILAKFYPHKSISIDLGPQVAFLLRAKAKSDGETVDIKKDMKSTEFALGAGVTWNIANFMVQGRYNLGLTDLVKDNKGGKKLKNGVIQLGVGYRF